MPLNVFSSSDDVSIFVGLRWGKHGDLEALLKDFPWLLRLHLIPIGLLASGGFVAIDVSDNNGEVYVIDIADPAVADSKQKIPVASDITGFLERLVE